MSFVYAVNDVCFVIMSDTKISINNELLKLWYCEDEKRLVEQIGLIKTIIISPNIVLCYAGNKIEKAAELLRNIKIHGDNLEKIVQIAFQIHNISVKDDIEFIIAYCDENIRELITIKNYQVIRNCKIAWIG